MATSARSEKAGLPPGTLMHIGEEKQHTPKISIIDYNETKFEEKIAKSVEECFPFRRRKSVTWINIDGIHDSTIIKDIGKHFGFHYLLLEDIMNNEQRPKIETFEDHIFVILKMLTCQKKEVATEQISIIIGKNFVISFQETEGDIFDPIRKRIRENKGKLRKRGADYLAYSLIDAIVDHYFAVLEKLEEQIEDVEETINRPTAETIKIMHHLKRQTILLQRSIWPLREVVSGMMRSESVLLKKTTAIYLRDVYDHTIQIMDTIETFRDLLAGMMEVYLFSLSNKTNEIMKVLTIIGTIFIPLTFITGVYGMNFDFMPALTWEYGYYAVMMGMLIIVIFLLFYFRKRRWI
ncbi:MAG: magnesium/cobalt transporter CorA [Nanoarchaeota archaeon]